MLQNDEHIIPFFSNLFNPHLPDKLLVLHMHGRNGKLLDPDHLVPDRVSHSFGTSKFGSVLIALGMTGPLYFSQQVTQ